MRIAMACDHGGFLLKEAIKEYLNQQKKDEGSELYQALHGAQSEHGKDSSEIMDIGTFSEESVNYPEYGRRCADAVVNQGYDRGIVCCGTGIGISMAANKVKGARCALCTSVEMAEMTRKHNDSNLLALGGRTTDQALAIEIVKAWLLTEFEGGRHQRRVDMLNEM